jgi:membrane-associated protease RseP (regulator of RpoE activity)
MSDPSTPLARPIEPARLHSVVPVARTYPRRYWLHGLFLLLTLFTTLVVGARLQYNFDHNLPAFATETYRLPVLLSQRLVHSPEPVVIELPFPLKWVLEQPQRLILGVPFAVTLMCILLAHELGHFAYCERNGVFATLPYFLPGPYISPIGTFGAVIRIKSPIRTRQALFDIGIAGPIAGFVVAVPVLFCGLVLSKPIVPQASGSLIDFGYPLIFHLSHSALRMVLPHTPALSATYLHPVGVAAWVGMLATALNLLPGGQLDGGHLVYAVAPRAHKWVTMVTVGVLTFLSLFWLGWLVWAIILGLIGRRHPPVAPWPGLSYGRRAWSVVAVLMLVLTWTPAPIVGQGWL